MLCCGVLWCDVCCDVVVVWPAAMLMGVMVTPAVCPRLFEFLTTLTFGALRKNHIVSTTFEDIAKKNTKK